MRATNSDEVLWRLTAVALDGQTSSARLTVPKEWTTSSAGTSRTVHIADREPAHGFAANVIATLFPIAEAADDESAAVLPVLVVGGPKQGSRAVVGLDFVGDRELLQLIGQRDLDGFRLSVVCSALADEWHLYCDEFDAIVDNASIESVSLPQGAQHD